MAHLHVTADAGKPELCSRMSLVNYACRDLNGRMLPAVSEPRSDLYCPRCKFKHWREGCLFHAERREEPEEGDDGTV